MSNDDRVRDAARRLVDEIAKAVEGAGARIDSIHPTSFGCSAYVRGGSPIVVTRDGRRLYSIVNVRVSDHGVGETRWHTDGGSYIDVSGDVEAQIAAEVAAFKAHYEKLVREAN